MENFNLVSEIRFKIKLHWVAFLHQLKLKLHLMERIDLDYAKSYIKLSFEEKQKLNKRLSEEEKTRLGFALSDLYDLIHIPTGNPKHFVIIYTTDKNGFVRDFTDYQ